MTTTYIAIGRGRRDLGMGRSSGKTMEDAQYNFLEANGRDPEVILTGAEYNAARNRIKTADRRLLKQQRI